MSENIELSQGEVKVEMTAPAKSGKITFTELGMNNEDLFMETGHLRIVFNLDGIGEHSYYQVPTIEVAYKEEMGETHWQLDFNGETILDKTDHHGKSTVILFNRKKLNELEHRHENELVLHAEFPGPVHLIAEESYINFFS